MVVQPALKYEKELIRGVSNAYRSYTQQYECRILSIEPEIKYEGFGGGPSTGGGPGARAPWPPPLNPALDLNDNSLPCLTQTASSSHNQFWSMWEGAARSAYARTRHFYAIATLWRFNQMRS